MYDAKNKVSVKTAIFVKFPISEKAMWLHVNISWF